MEICKDPGYEDFEKQAWGFKVLTVVSVVTRQCPNSPSVARSTQCRETHCPHCTPRRTRGRHSRGNQDKRHRQVNGALPGALCHIISAHRVLTPCPQSSLLRYRHFVPDTSRKEKKQQEPDASSVASQPPPERRASKMRFSWLRPKPKPSTSNGQETRPAQPEAEKPNGNAKAEEPPVKKMPVFFIDEAHKLYVKRHGDYILEGC